MSRRQKSRQVKAELFLKCGKVCMYSMENYAKEKLVLHQPYLLMQYHIRRKLYFSRRCTYRTT